METGFFARAAAYVWKFFQKNKNNMIVWLYSK